MRVCGVALGAACLATAAGAQSWSSIQNPPGVEISLRVLDPHPYRQGEVIRVEMKLPGGPRGQTPQQEIWTFAGLLLDPEEGCGSVAKPCFLDAGGGGQDYSRIVNGINGPFAPGGELFLNFWLPALKPGRYRTAVLARKQVLLNHSGISSTYGYAEPAQYAVSGTLDLEILAASPGWMRQTVAASAATLKSKASATKESYEAREHAAQQLRFLDDPAAWQASLSLLPEQEWTLLAGLESTRRPAQVCELMQARIPAPEQVVTSRYLWSLQQVCGRAQLPPPPAPKTLGRPVQARIMPRPPAAPAAPRDPVMEAYFQSLRAYQTGVWEKATTTLAASLPQKQAGAKTAAFSTLLEYVQQHQNPAPPWVPAVSREFAAWWPSVDTPNRRPLLDLFATTIHSPEVVPLLESVLDRWKPGEYYEAVHAAISELNQIDPRRAQKRILAELVKPESWLDVRQLDLLPPAAVPPMDDALIQALAVAQRPPGWNPGMRMAAIARYATAKAEPRIKAIYESQQDPCQPELVAYFVRVDPAYADRIFHSHPWDMQVAPPRCTVQYFLRTPPLAMGPSLEHYLAAYLMHSNVYIKTTAVHQLGLYGSPAALGPLWDAFRYFHDWWKGKGPELEQNGEGVHLETELRNAIARSPNWLASETDLRMIESLCVSRQCLWDTQQDLAAWQQPLRIDFAGPSGGWRWRVAQYSGNTDLAGLEAKLAQFPRGTRFTLEAGQAYPKAADRLREFASFRGFSILPR